MSNAKNVWKSILDGDDIGGRATDLGQIGMSIVREVNDEYCNRTPREVQVRLLSLAHTLDQAEAAIQAFAKFMRDRTHSSRNPR